jgi:hypothetical protein
MDDLGKVTEYEAVISLVGQKVSYHGEYVFHDGQKKPSQSKIDAEVKRLQAEYDAQEYARQRALAYPSVGDQLDMLMKDKKNGTNTHQEACEAVKTKYPKS